MKTETVYLTSYPYTYYRREAWDEEKEEWLSLLGDYPTFEEAVREADIYAVIRKVQVRVNKHTLYEEVTS